MDVELKRFLSFQKLFTSAKKQGGSKIHKEPEDNREKWRTKTMTRWIRSGDAQMNEKEKKLKKKRWKKKKNRF